MNDAQVRKNHKLDSEDVFITDNAADFPPDSPVAFLTAEINVERENILRYDAMQASGFAGKRAAHEIYEDCRRRLADLLDKYVLAAAIVDDDIKGTAARFKNPYPRSDQKLIARAVSFHADSADIESELKRAGLDEGDRVLLLTGKDQFQQAAGNYASCKERQAEATGGLIESFRKAMALSRRRDKRVKMKYRDNPAKLAAWAVASHLERPPKRGKKLIVDS